MGQNLQLLLLLHRLPLVFEYFQKILLHLLHHHKIRQRL
jgi:hypothetical protein